MLKIRNKYSISIIIAIIIGSIYLLNLFFSNSLTRDFALNPVRLLNFFETWRLVTYAFTPSNYEGMLLFVLTFFIIAPRLERRFNKAAFSLILLLLICLQGTLLTLIYWGYNINITGMEGTSFFVLTLFTLLELPKKIYWMKHEAKRYIAFSTILALTWFSSILLHYSIVKDVNLLYSFTSASIGIIASILIYIQIRIVNKITNKHLQSKTVKPKEPEFIGTDTEQDGFLKQLRLSQNKYDFLPEDDIYGKSETGISNSSTTMKIYSEDELNRLLDKINAYGKESLTTLESDYLIEYSKLL